MKKILCGILAVFAVVFCFVQSPERAEAGGPISFGVSTNSIKILPMRTKNPRNATTWTNGIVLSQGDIVVNSNRYFMAMVGGSAGTNAPVHRAGEGTDSVLTYYRIPSDVRKGLVIVNDSSVDINLSFGYAAVTNKGVLLKANGGSYSLDNDSFQGSVHAVAQAAGSNLVSVIELD